MKPLHLKRNLIATLTAISGTAFAAPVPLTGTMTYRENFDSLGAGTLAWTDDATLQGWYAQINNGATTIVNALAADGAAVLTGLLNCGTTGNIDRALGSKPTGDTTSNIAYAVSFHNTSTSPVQLTRLDYTGELWRTNTGTGTPLQPVDEKYTVFYQISGSAVTNILSGPNSATASAGAGFTPLGTGANWINPVNSPLGTRLDGNANRTAASFTPPVSIAVPPGQYLMIKWTDPNVAGTDGFQAIDDIVIEFTELTGSITAAASARTRNFAGTPLNNADDTFGFSATVNGNGTISAGWITSDVNPPAGNAAFGPYATPVTWTGFPIAPKSVTILDSVNAAFATGVTVEPLLIMGSNNLAAAETPILQEDAPLPGWTIDDSARTLNLTGQALQGDKIVNSEIVDLSGTGFVQFTAELHAITGTTNGFEDEDSFALQLIVDGGAPASVLGDADVDFSGRLIGLDDALGPGTELPGNDEPAADRVFTFSQIILDTANSVQIRVIGNSNSAAETFRVQDIKLNPAPPTVFASLAGPSVFDNKGTVAPGDDEFSCAINIVPVKLGASSGWHSNEAIPRTGLYPAPNPVTFGPYPVSGGIKTVTLTDDLAVPAISSSLRIPPPPAPALTASALTNMVRIENGPGTDDDGLSFDVVITGTNGGPGWIATGATPASGPFGLVTFRIPAPLPVSPFTVTVSDVSYPAVTLPVSIVIPARYTIGQQNLGGGVQDILTDLTTAPAPEWINDAGARTLTMTTGPAADGIVTSEVINLSSTGTVYFTASLNARETSNASNFETGDRFKAELIIDGGTATEEIINLVSSWDTGDGSAAIGAGGGPNGPPNGYINGFQGIAVAPANAEADYNNNRDRDEFNLPAGDPPARQIADISINNNFPLSYTVPAAANSVQLKIYGAGVASTETLLVSGVLFSTDPPSPDADGDGVSSTDEITMGTDPNDANDVLRLSQNAGNPNQLDFPTKAGRFYRVYVSDDSDGQETTHLAAWKDASLPTIAGDGTPASFNINVFPGEARRFYRLHVMATDGITGAGDWPATTP